VDEREGSDMRNIMVYGAPWCPDCRRSKRFLDEQRIAYDWVDIDQRPQAAAFVRELHAGSQIIPTIVFPTVPSSRSRPTPSSRRRSGSRCEQARMPTTS
jgi:glutaredoxin